MQRLGGKFIPLDPDEPMVGKCTVCGTILRTVRSKTFKDSPSPDKASLGLWLDIPYIECPICKKESEKIIQKAGTIRQPVGTRVYVSPIPLERGDV